MGNDQTLELEIKATAREAKTSIDSLTKSLSNIENVLTNIYLDLGKMESHSKTSLNSIVKKMDDVDKKTNNASKSTNNLNNNLSKLKNTLKYVFSYAVAKKVTTSFLDSMKLAVDYTEQLNLFNVVFKNIEKNGVKAFSEVGKEATKFQNRLNEKFGTNKTETLYMQGIYQSMGENVGIEDKYAAIMSESMTKYTYDLASLYNKNEKDVAEALRAGVYAGQTKPLRAYGIDVTQQSMQPILDQLGIDRSVKELSQAEKEILRYIAALKQGKVAMGDFANTIESPSNQLKIMRQQLVEAKVAFNSLFIGAFGRALPYINAVLMVIKEVSKATAMMFGIELTDYNTSIASQSDMYDDLGESASDASDKVKELKKQVFGFDQINNIDTQKNKDNSGSSVSGGIDKRLLDAIQGYDNGMDRVKMKATEIRDRIMEWLGLTKHVNEETGETYFTFDDTNATLYKLIGTFKDIWKYGSKVISDVFRILKDDFDNGIFGQAILGVFTGIKNVLKFISEHEGLEKFLAHLLELYATCKLIKGIGAITGITKLMTSLGLLNGTVASTIGVAGGATGLYGLLGVLGLVAVTWTVKLVIDGLKDVQEATKQADDAIYDLTHDTNRFLRELIDLCEAGDTTSKHFNELSNYLEKNAERQIETANAAGTTKEQHDRLMKSAEQTLEIFKLLSEKNPELRDEYIKLAKKLGDLDVAFFIAGSKIEGTKEKTEDLTTAVSNGKNSLGNFSDAIGAINKSSLPLLNTSLMSSKDRIDLLKNSISNSKLPTLNNDLTNAGNSANTSKDKIRAMQDEINRMSGKKVTLEIDGNMTNLKNKLTDTIKTAFGGSLNALFGGGSRAIGGSYYAGSWHNIQQYANGGSPTHGTVFVAGERGSEIVGHINGRTEVLNQSQIASAIYSAVLNAMSQSGSRSQVDVRVHSDNSVVIDEINQITRQTGSCPIDIPLQ